MRETAKIMDNSDPYEKYRERIRGEGFCLNPYRLGIVVGKAGEDLPSPYASPRSTAIYERGKKAGQKYASEDRGTFTFSASLTIDGVEKLAVSGTTLEEFDAAMRAMREA